MEKVIITPSKKFSGYPGYRQKAIIKLEDELQPNTTYTIDFTDAIVDNNEGNPLENFSISFPQAIISTRWLSPKSACVMNLEPNKVYMWYSFQPSRLCIHKTTL